LKDEKKTIKFEPQILQDEKKNAYRSINHGRRGRCKAKKVCYDENTIKYDSFGITEKEEVKKHIRRMIKISNNPVKPP
jgi:hypothetical protein